MSEDINSNIQFEAKLIEQEHRLLPIITNLYQTKFYSGNDPRKLASVKALFYKLILGSGATLALGGIISWATLYFTAIQTDALRYQNEILRKELEFAKIDAEEQRWIDNIERRTELLKILYSKNQSTQTSYRLKSEALVEFIELQGLISKKSFNKFYLSGSIPHDTAMYKFGINLTDVNLVGVRISQIDFSRTILHHANFHQAKLFSSNFADVPLDWANFSNSDLRNVNFSGASLLGANLTNAFIENITWNDTTKILMANIHGVKNPPKGYIEWAIKNGAIDEPNQEEWLSEADKIKSDS